MTETVVSDDEIRTIVQIVHEDGRIDARVDFKISLEELLSGDYEHLNQPVQA